MSEKILLIDFENVPKVDLAAVPEGVRVFFFFGASQRTVTRDFMKSALKLGERFVDIDIEGQGKNALDFHIAFYLGESLAKEPAAECVILSKDKKGFDPLVKHLASRKFIVRRVDSLADAFPPAATSAVQPVDVDQVVALLTRSAIAARPKKRGTLVSQIVAYFRRQALSTESAEALVAKMLSNKRIAEVDGKLTYNF